MLKVSAIRTDSNNAGRAVIELVPAAQPSNETPSPGMAGNESKMSRIVNLDPEVLRGLTVGDLVEDIVPKKALASLTE